MDTEVPSTNLPRASPTPTPGEPHIDNGPSQGSAPWKTRLLTFAGTYGTVVVFALLFLGFAIAEPDFFLTRANLTNVLNQAALGAIIAGGLTVVLIVGEFDLSIGANASLAGVLIVGLLLDDLPVPLGLLLVVLVGGCVGLANGLIVTRLGVNALIATLGTSSLVVGLNYAYSDGIPRSLSGTAADFSRLALGRWAGVPYPVFIMAGVLIILWILIEKTDLGQRMQAVGGNPEAAALAGISVSRTKTLAFMVAGLCAALTGALLAARTGSGQIAAGNGYLLPSFAAAFLGSTALRDGEFHIVGTFIGVMTVAVGFNGLTIIGVPSSVQFLFEGTLLVSAVALSTVARRRAG